jgi:xanthine/uracil permease
MFVQIVKYNGSKIGIFSSGITTGGLAAIFANVLIRVKEDKTE